MSQNNEIEKLIHTIKASPSPFHTVIEGIRQLKEAGFRPLLLNEEWNLSIGEAYFVPVYQSSLFAFRIGSDSTEGSLRIAAAHTDHPSLRIKPSPDLVNGRYHKINVEVYGGPILNTWLDRPLSAAGRVALASNDVWAPDIRLVDFKRSIATIPNLAIHMNREVNQGTELNRQIHMLPILGILDDQLNDNNYFMNHLAEELGVPVESILDFEIELYNNDEPERIGLEEEFLSSPRLDNLTSVQACLSGIINSSRTNGISVIGLFDNEEIGSQTKQGAGSALFGMILEKICLGLSFSRQKYLSLLADGMMISMDVAHGLHPNYQEKNDITNKVYLNKGFAIKSASSQSYATDCEVTGIIKQLCMNWEIPYQRYVNRSDVKGGGTLGSISSAWLNLKTIDVGIPILAMHSARELMGIKDQESLTQLALQLFSL